MADLEELGYIASPHTSAGRVPTPKGYRFFVDSLMVVKPLDEAEIHRLEGEFVADRPQQLLNAAAQVVSQLTQFAGVVVTPGIGYGPTGEGYIRLSLTIPDDRLEEGVRRMEALASGWGK